MYMYLHIYSHTISSSIAHNNVQSKVLFECIILHSLQIHDELSRLPLDSVPVFLTVACFLVQEGADIKLRNNRGQTAAQACPADKRDILINYINKSK